MWLLNLYLIITEFLNYWMFSLYICYKSNTNKYWIPYESIIMGDCLSNILS